MDYDWPYIQMRFEAGETAYAISKSMGGKPSKQGIAKRVKAEGWKPSDSSFLNVAEQLPSIKRALAVRQSKKTPETVAVIADLLSQGCSLEIAAVTAGISQRTLREWRSSDPELRTFLDRCRASSLATAEQVLHKAMFKDWKAAQAKLQAAPETRDQYGKGSTDNKVEIVINIDRSDGVTIEGQVIDDDEAA